MKKKALLIIILAIVISAATIFGIYRYALYEISNHADGMNQTKLAEINTVVTVKAQSGGRIGQQEILLLHTLHKDRQTDSEAIFYIYQLPEGAKIADYIDLSAADIGDTSPLVYMGTLTCRLVGEDPNTAYDAKIAYIR